MGLLVDRRRCYSENLEPLKLTLQDSAKVTFTLTVPAYTYNYLEYSIDNGVTWVKNVYDGPSSIETPVIEAGSSVLFRGFGDALCLTTKSTPVISCDSAFTAKGSLMSLLGKSYVANDSRNTGAFCNLFRNTKVTDASRLVLPSKMRKYMLASMFRDCTLLESAPKMDHIRHLDELCFSYMYQGCSSLRGIVKLNATTLAYGCYSNMFRNSGIEEIELPATELATECYNFMFHWCPNLKKIKCMALENIGDTNYTREWTTRVPSGGTFIKNSAAVWENVFWGHCIPSGWTVEYADE